MNYSKRRMMARLPSIPVFDEFKAEIVEVAKAQGKSVTQVIRDALVFYLSKVNTKCIDTPTDR
ncbi:MAG: hypothetical protein SF162_07570 [bacterium]|nr:hypothetical protein [bacterium]